MDPDALRAFLAVVEAGSFVAAATALRWSRATVRRRVDELEVVAGVPLLIRTEQGATPTAAGELLARRGQQILGETSALLSAVREVSAAPGGTLRVVLPVGLPPKLVTLLYGAFHAAHPELQIHARVAEDPLALLVHDVDVALCFGDEPPEGPWVSQEVLRVPERLLASAGYLAARGTPTSLEELRGHELMLWDGPERGGAFLPLRRGGELAVTPVLRSADLHMLRECASAGLGVLFAVDAALPGALIAGPELVPVLDALVGRERVLRIVMPTALPESRRLAGVLEQLRAMLRPLPTSPPPPR